MWMLWFIFWVFISGIFIEMGKDLYRTFKKYLLERFGDK